MKKIILLLLAGFFVVSCGTNKNLSNNGSQIIENGIIIPSGFVILNHTNFDRLKKANVLDSLNIYLSQNLIPQEIIERGFRKEKNQINVINGDLYEKHTVLQKDDKIIPPSDIDSLILRYKTDYVISNYQYQSFQRGSYVNSNISKQYVVFKTKYGDLIFCFDENGILRLNSKSVNFKKTVSTVNFSKIVPMYKYFYQEIFKKIE